ncbi:PIF1-like helicase-domain-containing protein [Mycena rebaudengoi]|nr:PIF1-like helicase-domain-containing protein [Mycena rebaudengoi]
MKLETHRHSDDAIQFGPPPPSQPKKPSHYRIKQETAVLSQQQLQISEAAQNGDSVFYTGSAGTFHEFFTSNFMRPHPVGTGKSVLLKNIIRTLRLKFQNDPEAVAVTALTGSAACNIGGITLHSFTGIGLGTEPVEVLVKKIRQNSKAYRRWLNTKVLVIDEGMAFSSSLILSRPLCPSLDA